jgi:hypothetical protein
VLNPLLSIENHHEKTHQQIVNITTKIREFIEVFGILVKVFDNSHEPEKSKQQQKIT